jgi:hypothetical protein
MGRALTSQLASATSTSAIISSINASLLSHSALKKRATCVPTSTPYASKHSSPLSCLSCASVYCGKSLIICRLVSCILCYSLFALLLSLLYRLLFLCQHFLNFIYFYFLVLFSCCACVVPRVVLVAIGSLHKVQPRLSHMQNPCQLAHWHTCCTPCKTRANFGRASCWHECCTPCKTHANSGPGTNVATQAKHVPTFVMQESCQ